MKKIKIGEVGVDSGQLIVCDPCYIDSEWKKEDLEMNKAGGFEPAKNSFSYPAVCAQTLGPKNYGGQLNYKMGHPGVAVAFSSGLGDGVYPVYAFIEDDRVWKVEIDMGLTKTQKQFFKKT